MTEASKTAATDKFQVSFGDAFLNAMVHRHRSLWLRLGNLETRALRDATRDIEIDKPVFIAGLARSGTTILLELFSSLQGVGTHRYRDFPAIYTPYWWNWFVDQAFKRESKPQERAHGDRIQVTAESPEAMEEPLWTAFFPALHDPAASNVLDGAHRNPGFDRFYVEHLQKLLFMRGATRYVSKGNYNLSRLEYLQSLFPDARFVIPVREPVAHVASLMKQHTLFCKACQDNQRALDHLRWVGHFEFGPDRQPVNMGDTQCIEQIQTLWRAGDDVRGWSRYWRHVYGAIADRLDANPALAQASMLVRYETLCASPADTVRSILAHAELDFGQAAQAFCEGVSLPGYYKQPFDDQALSVIAEETRETAARFGY